MAKSTLVVGKGLTKSILRRLRAQGMTVTNIAAHFGTTPMTIYRRFNSTVKSTTRALRRRRK